MKKPKTITVKNQETKKRLDIFIAEKLDVSRSQVQKMIAEGLVLVNNKTPKKTGDHVKEGDVICIQQHNSTTAQRISNIAIKQYNNKKEGVKNQIDDKGIKIIQENSDYIVIEKPTGILVHATQANETNTLVNFLLKKYPEIKKVGDSPLLSKEGRGVVAEAKTFRPGIVHRLDKEASGLLVVARTQKMFNHLKDQFKARTVEKEYWALVHGKVAKDWDILTFPIARSENFERMAARPVRSSTTVIPTEATSQERSGGISPNDPRDSSTTARASAQNDSENEKNAKTEFLVEKRFVNFTLLRVILHTGRMHQIRVHMLAYNHPLVGDPLYFQKKRKRTWDKKLGRLFLHSAKLSFTDLNDERQTFESSLPEDLEYFLSRITKP